MYHGKGRMQYIREQGPDITPIFEAGSVALIGASEREGSLGTVVLKNLVYAGFDGPIYPVNPKHEEVQGMACYSSLRDIDKPVDLASLPPNCLNCGAVVRGRFCANCGQTTDTHVPTLGEVISDTITSALDLDSRLEIAQGGVKLL